MKYYESPGFLFCYLITLGPIIPLEICLATFLFLFLNQEEQNTPALMGDVIDLDGASGSGESAAASKSQAAIAASVLIAAILLQLLMAASIIVQRSVLVTRSKYRALLPFAARSEGYTPVGAGEIM